MAKVTFKDNGDEVEVENGSSLQDVSTKNSWPIAFGCGNGVCGTCMVEVTEGKENVSKIDETENQTLEMMGMTGGNYRLACRCKINGDVEIKSL